MPRYILYKDGAYNVYSTIVDAPLLEYACTLEQLEHWYKEEYGNADLSDLQPRLERAHETGCSSRSENLKECLSCNRAGENESELSFDEFVARFLTLPE